MPSRSEQRAYPFRFIGRRQSRQKKFVIVASALVSVLLPCAFPDSPASSLKAPILNEALQVGSHTSTVTGQRGWVKTAFAPSALQNSIAPLDPAMNFCRPKQLVVLPPVPDALIQALNQQSAHENSRRLQIGLHRAFDSPLVV